VLSTCSGAADRRRVRTLSEQRPPLLGKRDQGS